LCSWRRPRQPRYPDIPPEARTWLCLRNRRLVDGPLFSNGVARHRINKRKRRTVEATVVIAFLKTPDGFSAIDIDGMLEQGKTGE
jgi:hypothetical protein